MLFHLFCEVVQPSTLCPRYAGAFQKSVVSSFAILWIKTLLPLHVISLIIVKIISVINCFVPKSTFGSFGCHVSVY